MDETVMKRIAGLFDGADITLGRCETREWGEMVNIDVENVSVEPGRIFARTIRYAKCDLGVDANYIGQNAVKVVALDDDGRTVFACGHHTMGENGDEGHQAFFHGVAAIPNEGGHTDAACEIERMHQKDVVDGAREMLGRIVEIMGAASPQSMAGLSTSVEARRFMRRLAESA